MFPADVSRAGYWLLEHNDGTYDERLLVLSQAAEFLELPSRGRAGLDKRGPILTGLLWETEDQAKKTRFWSFGAAATKTAAGLKPVEGPGWMELRDGMRSSPAATPFDEEFPEGWPFLVQRAAYGFERRELAAPLAAGIVAPFQGGRPPLGTSVWELEGDGLDLKRRARAQSAWRTYLLPDDGCLTWGKKSGYTAGIALQLGEGLEGYAGHGMCADQPPSRIATQGGGQAPIQVLGVGSYRGGGAWFCGHAKDKHQDGSTGDGEPINPLHAPYGLLFASESNPELDAPLEWRNPYPEPARPPFPVDAGIYYDIASGHTTCKKARRGLHRLVAWCYFSRIEPPDPPPDPPPPKKPPPDGDPLPEPRAGARPPKLPPLDGEGSFPEAPIPDGPLDGGFEDPFGPGARIYGRIASDPGISRPLHGATHQMAFSSLAFRPQYFEDGAIDLRSIADVSQWTEEHRSQWSAAPVVALLHSVGRQYGGGEWGRTQELRTGQFPDAGGTAPGMLFWGIPELDPALLLNLTETQIGQTFPQPTRRSKVFVGHWRTRPWVGTPMMDGSAVPKDGFSLDLLDSGGTLYIVHHDSAGAETVVARLSSAGDLRIEGELFQAADMGYGLSGESPSATSTGWDATIGSSRKDFDSSTVTLSELAEVVGTWILEARTKGLVKA